MNDPSVAATETGELHEANMDLTASEFEREVHRLLLESDDQAAER